MRATPKWNEELPLQPKPPLPPPRRFEIVVDGGKPVVVAIKSTYFPSSAPSPRMEPSKYEIKGTSLREDELIEHAADASKDALIIDSRGGLHRPGETFLPRNVTMSVGSQFFPPTYVGKHVRSYPPGRVISRQKLRHLIRTGQIKKPPNMVNSFPPGRLRKRKKPFPPRLALQAVSLTDPGAFHGLVIPPGTRVSGARLASAVANGRVHIGSDGSVYVRNEMGIVKKVGRLAKKGAKGVARTTKKAARPVTRATKKVARPVGRFVKKNAVPIAMTAALGPAGIPAYAAAKNLKKIGAVAKKVGKWTGRQLAAAAKAVARVAATPIRMAVRPAVNAAVKKLSAGRPPTAQTKRAANKLIIAQLKRNPNPLVKFSGTVLSYTGTGVSGISGEGQRLLEQYTTSGCGLIVGATPCPGQAPTVMGLTGAEISALASSAVAALIPVVKKMVADLAVAKTQQVVTSALSPATKATSSPPEISTKFADEPAFPDTSPSYPSAQEYENLSYPSAEQYEQPAPTYIAPTYQMEEPTYYAEEAYAVEYPEGIER